MCTDCNSIYLACGFWLKLCFFSGKVHGLATIPSFCSMYSTGLSLSAHITTPVWHAESSTMMSGSFHVRDRDRRTLEIQVNCCSVRPPDESGLLEDKPNSRVDPENCCLSGFLFPLRGPITCADSLRLCLWCIWAQSHPTETESSLWSIQHYMPGIPEAWDTSVASVLVYYFFRLCVALTAP